MKNTNPINTNYIDLEHNSAITPYLDNITLRDSLPSVTVDWMHYTTLFHDVDSINKSIAKYWIHWLTVPPTERWGLSVNEESRLRESEIAKCQCVDSIMDGYELTKSMDDLFIEMPIEMKIAGTRQLSVTTTLVEELLRPCGNGTLSLNIYGAGEGFEMAEAHMAQSFLNDDENFECYVHKNTRYDDSVDYYIRCYYIR